MVFLLEILCKNKTFSKNKDLFIAILNNIRIFAHSNRTENKEIIII